MDRPQSMVVAHPGLRISFILTIETMTSNAAMFFWLVCKNRSNIMTWKLVFSII